MELDPRIMLGFPMLAGVEGADADSLDSYPPERPRLRSGRAGSRYAKSCVSG